ncbi:MAG: hypothetical protein ACKVS5_09790 [Parvularculaceae bacterium]
MSNPVNRGPQSAPPPQHPEAEEKPQPPSIPASRPEAAQPEKSRREDRLAKALRDNLRRRKAVAKKDQA